ncbi:hypothetical protein ACFWAP_03885 [Streptomyces goshikiensis]|uniref:hypothetical protein n=1 Tax=Streptomyces goshikiensis TaxID=1942 RepID=UPI00364C772B
MIHHRYDIATALEAAGWTDDVPGRPGVLQHPSGASWMTVTAVGDGVLRCTGEEPVTFAGHIPTPVVIAACLAASGQLDPSKDRVKLEERSSWLGCLERAGVDGWQGYDVARDLRGQ